MRSVVRRGWGWGVVLCLLLVLAAGSVPGSAQEAEGQDELRLRSGTVLRGNVIEVDRNTVIFRSGGMIKEYRRSEVRALFFEGQEVASTGGPPPGISAADGFKVASWHTLRRITSFPRGEGAHFITDLRLTADGSKIGFNSHRGLFTMNADGTNITRATDIRAEYWDMTPDAKRFVWYHRDRGLYVVNGDGSGSQKLPGELAPWALRITAKGDKAILWAGERGALFSINTDGSDIKQVTNIKAIAKAHGTVDENFNHFRYHGLAISDDGSRCVLHHLWDMYAVDSTGVRRITNLTGYGLKSLDISPDGSKIAFLDGGDPVERHNLQVMSWNGEGRRVVTGIPAMLGGVQVLDDGTALAYLGDPALLRTFHPDGSINDLQMTGDYAHRPGVGHAMAAVNGRRIAFMTEGPLSTDQGRPHQVWICDVRPASIEGHPTLTGAGAFPRFVLTDGSTRAVVSAVSNEKDPMGAGGFMFPKNVILPSWDIRYFYHVLMNDSGQGGDEKAADGKYSHGFLQLRKEPKELDPGPVMLRVWLRSKADRMTVVDLEGMEMRRP